MGAWIWLVLPVMAALASGVLSYCLMQARLDTAVANERRDMADARAKLDAQQKTLDEIIRATEQETRRKAFDEFLSELHVEERRYIRDHKMMFAHRRSMVLAERMFFRNIPLSSWVEHELPFEEGVDMNQMARSLAVFRPDLLLPAPQVPALKTPKMLSKRR